MYKYTQNEKVDMLLVYGECRKNARNAAGLYQERYPDRNHPCFQYFLYVEEYLRRNQNVDEEEKYIIDEETEINVLAMIEINKSVSVREIAKELPVGRESARKILKKHGYKSFKYQLHQHLYADDGDRRIEFCNWILQNNAADQGFINSILFSDESRFTNNGMFNRQNTRYWAKENQHEMRQGNFQERFGVNVWAGVVGRRIIGPILFQGQLTAERYLAFLRNNIEEMVDQLPLEVVRRLYFQQDGAPPHNARQVVEYLGDQFNGRVIATNGPVRWPPRSPDLTVLDFFIWGHVKNQVFLSTPRSLQDLEQKILEAFRSITPEMLENALRSTINRAELCIQEQGMHFEHLMP